MRRGRKKKNLIIFCLVGLMFLLVVGYAAFQIKLEIKGTSNISSEWRIEITNVSVANKNGLGENVNFEHTKTTASMEANLYEKGDYVEYNVEVSNLGTLDAEIDNIANNIKSTNKAVKISFSGYAKGQVLKAKQKQNIKAKIEYDSNFTGDVPEGPAEVEIQPEYVQHNPGGTTPLPDRYLVSYDCTTNGGKDCTENNEYLTEGDEVNLNPSGVKENYTFVGWNTNKSATSGLTSLTMGKDNMTLYAIYKANTISVDSLPITLSASSYTYDGSAKTPSVTVKSGDVTLTKDTDYTVEYKNNTNAGNATVTVKGKGKYSGTVTKTFKIDKATPTITLSASSGTVVKGKTLTFNEKASVAGKFTNASSNTDVATVSPATSSSAINANTNTAVTVTGVANGTANISVNFTPTDTTNYNNASAKTFVATITNSATKPTAANYCQSLTYNGSSQTLTKAAGSGYTFSNNTRTNAGSQTVTATLASGYRWSDNTTAAVTFSCSIAKAAGTVTLSAFSGTINYGTASKTFTVSSNKSGGSLSVSDDNDTATSSINSNTVTIGSLGSLAAGTKVVVTVTSAATDNYNLATAKYTLTVNKANPTVSLTAKTATYSGSAIAANTATVSPSTGGALSYVYYSDSSCSTKVTTSTGASAAGAAPKNAGTYYVKATVAATTNYNSASSSCTKHTINKKADTITLSAKSTTYTGNAIAANTATATSGTAITYTYYSSTDCSGTALTSTPINVGNYSVKAVSAGNGNYSSGSKCVTHTITQGTPTISLTAKTATYTGNAIAANTATAKAPNGSAVTLTYAYKYYSDNTCSTQVTTATGASAAGAAPKNAGTYYVKATSTATSNLKAASSSCVAHTINKKAPTLTLASSTTSVGYNNGTASVTYTYDGDGTVSCTSSNTSYATCSVNTSNKTITITGKAYTTTKPTITIKAAAGTNYSAATNKTITVTLTDGVKPTISFSPNTQSSYVSGGKVVTVTLADAGSGLKASQTVSYAWSTSSTTAPTSFTNLTTSNSAGAASTTVTVPASASASLTGTYYLWIKVGTVADVSGNTNAVKTSGAFKFDNTVPSVSLSTSKTTNSITVATTASATSGISKYEYSKDGGSTWVTGTGNTHTFTGLTQNKTYSVSVRVTSTVGKTNSASGSATTNAIATPTFTEKGTSTGKKVTITYPAGCGSTYTCSYIKDGGTEVPVKSTTADVQFTASGNLVAKINDGTNYITSSSYTVSVVTMKAPVIDIDPSQTIGYGYNYRGASIEYMDGCGTTYTCSYVIDYCNDMRCETQQTGTLNSGKSKTFRLTSPYDLVYARITATISDGTQILTSEKESSELECEYNDQEAYDNGVFYECGELPL